MNFINVGQIVGAHGIKGEVKVEVLTDFAAQRFAKGAKLYVEKKRTYMQVQSVRENKGLLLLKLAEVPDRNMAEELFHSYLQVSAEDRVDLPQNTYYHTDLLGLSVYENDVLLGELVDIFATGANDVYVVKSEKEEFLLPALKSVVKNIDLGAKRMDVEVPEGLRD